jgi:hypothetical protein
MDQLKDKAQEFHEMIYEVKGEFEDEVLRLRKERSDIQIMAQNARDTSIRVNCNIEKAMEEMQRLHVWNLKIKDILTL